MSLEAQGFGCPPPALLVDWLVAIDDMVARMHAEKIGVPSA